MESQSRNPEFRKKLITLVTYTNRCETGAAVSQLKNIIKGNEGQTLFI